MSEFAWIAELEKAVRKPGCEALPKDREAPYEGQDDNEDDGEEFETRQPMRKGGRPEKGRYAPAPNGDVEEDGEEPKVHDSDSIDKKSGGGKLKQWPETAGGIKKGLSEEAVEAIEISPVLTELAKSMNAALRQRDAAIAEVKQLRGEVEQIHKSLGAIGGAMVKALANQEDLNKSLASDVENIGRQPRERKSTLNVMEKSMGPKGAKNEVPTPTVRLQKSMKALEAGKITAHQSAILEQSANIGQFRHDIWELVEG